MNTSGIVGGVIGVVLTATVMVASTSIDTTVYKDTGDVKNGATVYDVTGDVCIPLKVVATTEQMKVWANKIQVDLDSHPEYPQEHKDNLEKTKSFFIEHADAIESGSATIATPIK